MKRIDINILAGKPIKTHKYMIVPHGLYCNRGILDAQNGDILTLQHAWRKENVVFVRSCSIKTSSSIFSFMFKSLYGNTPIESVFAKWEALCVNEGLGEKAFDREEVLLVEVCDIDNN